MIDVSAEKNVGCVPEIIVARVGVNHKKIRAPQHELALRLGGRG
jgi:hypothetical protein